MKPYLDFFFNFSLSSAMLTETFRRENMKKWISLSLLALAGCFQTFNDNDLHTVPVTNNPHIVPNHGSGLPMMGGGDKGPY